MVTNQRHISFEWFWPDLSATIKWDNDIWWHQSADLLFTPSHTIDSYRDLWDNIPSNILNEVITPVLNEDGTVNFDLTEQRLHIINQFNDILEERTVILPEWVSLEWDNLITPYAPIWLRPRAVEFLETSQISHTWDDVDYILRECRNTFLQGDISRKWRDFVLDISQPESEPDNEQDITWIFDNEN